MIGSDHGEFAAFYAASKDRCLHALLALHPDTPAADDLVAEAFTRAWERWADVRAHPSPIGWVLRTATNLRIDQWRRATRIVRLDSPATSQLDARLDPQVVAALGELSERQREVVVLRVLLDMSNRDTANALGIEPSTVPVHLRRALAALRTHLPIKEDPCDHAR